MDIRQSTLYARFMKSLGWKVERIGQWQIFIKPFPLIGSFIKIQRIGHPFPEKEIMNLARKHRAFRVIIEPDYSLNNRMLSREAGSCSAGHVASYKLHDEIFSPSKTILIDLTPSEQKIFDNFSESKRRAVLRAEKNKVLIQESSNIEAFVALKSRQMFPFGFLLSREIRLLWKTFKPQHSSLLFAYHSNDIQCTTPLAGVLLLFWQKRAYYWLASATDKGKKLFAPTLLVWEALKLAKKKGCTAFDFEGVFDQRFPKATKSWQGFTKFKEGFGGKEIEYPKPLILILHL